MACDGVREKRKNPEASKKTETPLRAADPSWSQTFKILWSSLRKAGGNMRSVEITVVTYPILLSGQQNPNFVQVSGGDSLTPGYHSMLTNMTQGNLLGSFLCSYEKEAVKEKLSAPLLTLAACLQAWYKDVRIGAVAAIL